MPDYSRGKIYMMSSPLCDKVYYGSTTKEYLSQRLTQHVSDQRRDMKRGSQVIIEAGEYVITLLELYPCTCRDELHAREQYHMNLHTGSMSNKYAAAPSKEQKAVKKAANDKRYTTKHNEKILSRHKEYYILNKESIDAKNRLYAEVHKEETSARQKLWGAANKEEISARRKLWGAANKEAIGERQRAKWAIKKDQYNARKRAKRAADKIAAHTI